MEMILVVFPIGMIFLKVSSVNTGKYTLLASDAIMARLGRGPAPLIRGAGS
jgi:hypothetical protein